MKGTAPLQRKVGYSIACQGILLLLIDLFVLLFAEEYAIDFNIFILIVLGLFVRDGYNRALPWAVAVMFLGIAYPILLFYLLNIYSDYDGFYNYLNPVNSFYSFLFVLMFSIWSLINFVLLIRILVKRKTGTV